MHCVTVVRLFKKCQNLPTGHLCCRGADCFSNVRTYLRTLCCRGADCLSSVRTYLQALCYSGAGWLSGVGTYLQGTVLQWCRMFKQCQNLPAGFCITGVQSV